MRQRLGIGWAFGAASTLLFIQVTVLASTAIQAGMSAPTAAGGMHARLDDEGRTLLPRERRVALPIDGHDRAERVLPGGLG